MSLFHEYEKFSTEVRRLRPKTVSEYMRVLRDVSRVVDLLKVTGPAEIDEAVISLSREKGWEPVYEYKYSRILKPFFEWLFYKKYTETNLYPYSRIRKPKPKEPSFITQKEFDFIYKNAEKSPVITRQDLTLFRLMWDTGIRRSEASSLDVVDVKLDESYVELPREKTKGAIRQRYCPYTPYTSRLLTDHLDFMKSLGLNDHLFVNEDLGRMSPQGVYLRIKKIALVADRGLKPHALRHSLGVRILENGGDIGFVARLLGHESLNTSLHYTNLAKENSKALYEKYVSA